ncbi:hypothetical protein TrCOL_g833 [Triparma columacea]|uniref:Uncharacterized protein n=1 Tax=Triparma columacea TaxID=722753 RepID=A0A9W7L5F3_9STRA|nr:hypothetical protein TrCOL_g833 [Triparma columacea]
MSYVIRRKQSPSKDKKAWSVQEDQSLLNYVKEYGTSSWSRVSESIKTRTGKQCRERYHNHLDPNVKKGGWSKEEDALILSLQKQYGNAWAKITSYLPGRTDNAVKNRYWSATRSAARKMKTTMNRQQMEAGCADGAATLAAPRKGKVCSVEKENKSGNNASVRKLKKKSNSSSNSSSSSSISCSAQQQPSSRPFSFVPPSPSRARAHFPLPPPSVVLLAEKMKRQDDLNNSGIALAPSIVAVDYLSDEEISSHFMSGFSGGTVVSTESEEESDEESLGGRSSEESEVLDMTDFFFFNFKEEPFTSFYDENIIIPPLY